MGTADMPLLLRWCGLRPPRRWSMDSDPRACSTGRSWMRNPCWTVPLPSIGRFHRFGVRWCGIRPPRCLSMDRDPLACCIRRRRCFPSIGRHHRFGVRWCGSSLPRCWSMDRDPRACCTGRSCCIPSTGQSHQRARSEPPCLRWSPQGTQPLALT